MKKYIENFKKNTIKVSIFASLLAINDCVESTKKNVTEVTRVEQIITPVIGKDNKELCLNSEECFSFEKAENLIYLFKFVYENMESGEKIMFDSNNNKVSSVRLPSKEFITESGEVKQNYYDDWRAVGGGSVENQKPAVMGISMKKYEIESLRKKEKTLKNIILQNIEQPVHFLMIEDIHSYLTKISKEHVSSSMLQKFIIYGIPGLESQFDSSKTSSAGATGVYQLMKSRAKELGIITKSGQDYRRDILFIASKVAIDFEKTYQYFLEHEKLRDISNIFEIDLYELATYFSVGQWNWGKTRANRVINWVLANELDLKERIFIKETLGAFYEMIDSFRKSKADKLFKKDSFKYVFQSLAMAKMLEEHFEKADSIKPYGPQMIKIYQR